MMSPQDSAVLGGRVWCHEGQKVPRLDVRTHRHAFHEDSYVLGKCRRSLFHAKVSACPFISIRMRQSVDPFVQCRNGILFWYFSM